MANFIKKLSNRFATDRQVIKSHKKDICIVLSLGCLFVIFQYVPMYIWYAHSNLVLDRFLFALPMAAIGLFLISAFLFILPRKWRWTFIYVCCGIFFLSNIIFAFCLNR